MQKSLSPDVNVSRPNAIKAQHNPLPLGVYVGSPNANDSLQEANFQANLTQFTGSIGAAPTFIDAFVDSTAPMSTWVNNAQWGAYSLAIATDTKVMTPVIGVGMASSAAGSPSMMASFNSIINGAEDSVYLGIVNAYKAQGYSTIDLRVGWEMNANWFTWGPQNATEATAYVKAFRHIADLVHSDAGIKVNVVWNPAIVPYTPVPMASLYPGNSYVDIVAADLYSPIYTPSLYDWSTGKIDSSYAQWYANPVNVEHYWDYPAASAYNPTYDATGWGMVDAMSFAKAHGKPFGLGETGAGGTGPAGGPVDNPELANYLTKVLLAANAPKLAFVNVWDENVPDGSWKFSDGSRPLEAAAWANLVKQSLIGATDPGPSMTASGTIVGGGQTISLGSQLMALVTPGEFLDTETITSVSAALGTATLSAGNVVTYTAPASGTDALTYTVTDELGDSATGTYTLTADPGPSAGAGTITRSNGLAFNIGPQILQLVTPGLPGISDTITAVSALDGKVTLGANNWVTYVTPVGGTDVVDYTVTDKYGFSASGSLNVVVDTGPKVAAGSQTMVANTTVDLTSQIANLITPGATGDVETIKSIKAAHGTVTLGANNAITYTAPASGTDALTYTVVDQWGHTAYGTYTIAADPGPKIAASSLKVTPGETLSLTSNLQALITAGAASDQDSITTISSASGQVTLGTANSVTYIAPASGTDMLTFGVTNQLGESATGTYTIATDPGPSTSPGSITRASGWAFNIGPQIIQQVTPGLAGDHELITAVSALHGKVTLGANDWVTYSVPFSGTDTITYTVTDQLGSTATGSLNIIVDTGPQLAAGSTTVTADSTVSLTSQVASLITPGGAGDIETIKSVKAALGAATLGANNTITYTAPDSGTDTLTYTVTDQWGHLAVGTDVVTVVPATTSSHATIRLVSPAMMALANATHPAETHAVAQGARLDSLHLVAPTRSDLAPTLSNSMGMGDFVHTTGLGAQILHGSSSPLLYLTEIETHARGLVHAGHLVF